MIISKERQNLLQISVFFKKTKFARLKSIYFHFKTSIRQMLVLFKTLAKSSLKSADLKSLYIEIIDE